MPKKIKATKKAKVVSKAKPIKKGIIYQLQRWGEGPAGVLMWHREEGEEEEGQECPEEADHRVLRVHQGPQGEPEKGAAQAVEHRAGVGRELTDQAENVEGMEGPN